MENGRILSTLATLVMACTTDHPSDDASVNAALTILDQEAEALAIKFELAAAKALDSSKVFKEIGSQNGEAIMVDDTNTFGCIASDLDGGLLCEQAAVGDIKTSPNLVSLNRNRSTIVSVSNADLATQIIKKNPKASTQQDVSTMFLTENRCGMSSTSEGVSSSVSTDNPDIIKKCATLRDNLKARFGNVMKIAMKLKRNPGN